MKNTKSGKVLALMLLVTMLALIALSGTYAKYTSEANGSDTAIVAKWNVTAELGETVVDLFGASKIYDTNGADYTAGTDDLDVKNATTGNGIIAPGTWGEFSYEVKNDSDVTAEYTVDYTATEAGVPLEWSVDGTTWTADLADIKTAVKVEMGKTSTQKVLWRWSFDNSTIETTKNDTTDTALGTAGSAQPELGIKVTMSQVD